MSKQPPPASAASAVGPCPTVIKIVGRFGTGSLPSTIAPTDHPPLDSNISSVDKALLFFSFVFLNVCFQIAFIIRKQSESAMNSILSRSSLFFDVSFLERLGKQISSGIHVSRDSSMLNAIW